MNNRILAMLLAIIMVISMVPVNAFADEGFVHAEGCPVGNGEGGTCTCVDRPGSTTTTPDHTCTDTNHDGTCETCKKHIHALVKVPAVEATCQQAGNVEYYKCSYATCGMCYQNADGTVYAAETYFQRDKLEHSYGGYVTTDPAGHYRLCTKCETAKSTLYTHTLECKTVDGVLKNVCKICGYSETHNHVNEVEDCFCDTCNEGLHVKVLVEEEPATCKDEGKKAYYACENCVFKWDAETGVQVQSEDLVIPVVDHARGNFVVSEDKSTHMEVCPDCEGHLTDWTAHTLRVTDNHDGTHTVNCEQCDLNIQENHIADSEVHCVCEICDASMHVLEYVAEDPATCTEEGVAAHYKCTNGCRQWFTDKTASETTTQTKCKIDATGHSLVREYLNNGTHKTYCENCDYVQGTYDCTDGAEVDCFCEGCEGLIKHAIGNLSTVPAEAPTCEEDGIILHYQCPKCANLFDINCNVLTADQVVDPKLNHKPATKWVHNNEGHYHVCENAGCDEKLSMTAHTPGEYKEYALDAAKHIQQCTVCDRALVLEKHEYTYTSNGYGTDKHTGVCADCKKTFETNCKDENGDCVCDTCKGMMKHTLTPLSTVWEKDPTCKETGLLRHYQCPTCMKLFDINCNEITLESVTVAKVDHKWWPKGMDLSGTLHTEQCEYCKIIRFLSHFDRDDDCLCDYEGCNALAHSHEAIHVPAKDATCVEEGNQEYWYYEACDKLFADAACTQPLNYVVVYGKTEHTWSDWTGADSDNHKRECSVCDAEEVEEHVYSNNSNYCDVCDAAAGLEYVEQVDPTCDTVGYVAHWVTRDKNVNRKYLDEAGTKYIATVPTIDALGHDMDTWVGNAEAHTHTAVCGNGCGHTETYPCKSEDGDCFCDVCGYSLAGHTFLEYEYVAPTCTEDGQMAAVYCETCKKYYETEEFEVVQSIVLKELGHDWSGEWYDDSREGAHSKDCERGCGVKMTVAHELTCESVNKGNTHEWSCSICDYMKSGVHADKDGDTICDECGYESNKVVGESKLDNPRETITIKVDKDASVEEKKNTWWKDFVGKLNPSYVGESESSSAPSASVDSSSMNGSGTTVSGSVNSGAGSSSTGSSAVDAVITFLMNLLNALLGK